MAGIRLGLYLQDNHTIRESIRYVQYAELRGFEAVWQAESRLARDPVVPLAAYAAHTSRIRLGTGVMNIWTRNAATIASTFLTLDDLAPDRAICGLGTWYEPLAEQVGVTRRKPLLALRETTQAVRGLLALQTVTLRGEIVQLEHVSLGVAHGRDEPRAVPIYFGASGTKIAALAGEIADGILLNYLVSPSYNLQVMDELERGARKAGRALSAIDRPQLILCAVDRDRQKALDTARGVVAQYIAQQPQAARACGVPQALIDEVMQALGWAQSVEQRQDAARLVPDEVVQLLTAAGSADEVRDKAREYIGTGATCAVLCPLCDDVRYMIDVFTDRYLEE